MRHLPVVAVVFGGLLMQPATDRALAAGGVLEDLAGVWKAPRRAVRLSSDLHVAVWGEGASQVRDVELVIEPSGHAVVKVFNSVVGREGKTKAYSASVTEATLQLKASDAVDESRGEIRPEVVVINAEERYLDDPNDRRAVDGLQISLSAQGPNSPALNFRFDTARGRGSFGETLIRQNARSSP